LTLLDQIANRASPRRLLIAAVLVLIVVGSQIGGLGRPPTPESVAAPAQAVESGSVAPATSGPAAPDDAPNGQEAATSSSGPTSQGAATTLALPASPTLDALLASPAIPNFRHIYVIVMENREYGTIVGNPDAPYINGLIARYGLATNYRAVAHPSQPNYIALFSGSTQGVTDNGVHRLSRRNLVDQLAAHGISWRVFAQNVPLGCFTGATASGGPDGPGEYARKHEPAISFTSITRRPSRCAKIRDFSHFSPSIARFELIVPNMCNSMHDCSTAKGDAFLRGFMPKILKSPAMTGSVVFLTWDEGSSNLGGGGRIATVVIGPTVKRGYHSATRHSHYSLLRTIETAWGLGCLNRSCSANTLREFFR